MKLFLDDLRFPEEVPGLPEGPWVICRTPHDLYHTIHQHGLANIEAISFDHDLGSGWDTGYDCITELENECEKEEYMNVPDLYVHSANPAGRERIASVIRVLARKSSRQIRCGKLNPLSL